jgi:probable F420-dependent oxidoreductase
MLEIDVEVAPKTPGEVPFLAKRAESMGFGRLWVNETRHDPFVQLALASGATERIGLGTSVALAFTRSPTSTAYAAWDLQSASSGRLTLGLGTQVKGHLERRFGVRWESPVERMREVIGATRSVWSSWQDGKKLDYSGRFFKLDLMPPFFNPGPIGKPVIPIFVAGVNPKMCSLAGELCDGLLVHPLHTMRYLKEVVLPAVARGAGPSRRQVPVSASVFAAVGGNREEVEDSREHLRGQIAFYASTRTYRRVLELHGWGETCDRLHALSVEGRWKEMAGEVGDEILDEMVVQGTWEEVSEELRRRYLGVAGMVRIYRPFDGSEEWKRLLKAFRP